ncbi:conserved Plasmodium protein, unknown function [Plasmodium gallinaceum]|uniref:Uncharacterized protein n=1 Tax=Plasmodium gallinaceum TaxID=5849 RepID=A0A1J1GU93_PLAGA|nr:conserved Plasmodium protein, unknown function [Plasmodium gallinaceum]CRG95865.1 conserved Plasmodium protein, unknown function [Plasmodium gallinaceum]
MKDKKKSIYFYKDRQKESFETRSEDNNLNIYEKRKECEYDSHYENTDIENVIKRKSTCDNNSKNSKSSFFYEIENSEKSQNDYSSIYEKEKKSCSRKSFYSIYDYTDENNDSDYKIIKKNKKNNLTYKESCKSCYNDKMIKSVYDNNYYMHIYDNDNMNSNNLLVKSSNKNNNKYRNKNKYFNRKKKVKKDLINKIDELVKYYKIYNMKGKYHYVGITTILKKYIYVIKNNNILFFKKKLNNKKILLINKIKKRYNNCNTFYFIQKKYLYNIEGRQKKNKCFFYRYLYFCKLKKKLQNYYKQRKIKREKNFKNLMKFINSQIKKKYFFNKYIDCRLKDEFDKNKNIINQKCNPDENIIKKYLMYCFQNNIHNFRESLDNEENYKKFSKYKKIFIQNFKNYTNYKKEKQNEKKKNDITEKNKKYFSIETKMKNMFREKKNNKKNEEEFDICLDCRQLYVNYVKDSNNYNKFKNGILLSDINIIKKLILSRKEKNENYTDNNKVNNNNKNTFSCKNNMNEKKNKIYDNIKKKNNCRNRSITKNCNNNKNNIEKINHENNNNANININTDNDKNIDNNDSKNINDNNEKLINENNKIIKSNNNKSIINISIEDINATTIENKNKNNIGVNNYNIENINSNNVEEINNSSNEKINSDKNENMNNNSDRNAYNENKENVSINYIKNNNNDSSNEKEYLNMNKSKKYINLEKSLKNEMINEVDNFSINDEIDKTLNCEKCDSTYENEEKNNQKDICNTINYEIEIQTKMEKELKKNLEEIVRNYINNDVVNQDVEFNKIEQKTIKEKNHTEKDMHIEKSRKTILNNNSFSLYTHEENLDKNFKVESISNFFHSFQNINSKYINLELRKRKKKKKVKKKNKYELEIKNLVGEKENNEICSSDFKVSKDLHNFYSHLHKKILNEFKERCLKKMKKIFNKKCKEIEKDISENLRTVVNTFNSLGNINNNDIHICKKKKKKNLNSEIKIDCEDKKLTNNKVNTQIFNDKNNFINTTDHSNFYNNETRSDNNNIQHSNSIYIDNDFIQNNSITYINNTSSMENIFKSNSDISNRYAEHTSCNEIYKKQQNEKINITNLLNINKKNIYKKQNSLNSKKNYGNEKGDVLLNILRNKSLNDLNKNFIFKNLNCKKFCKSIKNDLNNNINVLKYLNIVKQKNVGDNILKKINNTANHYNPLNNRISDKNYINEFFQYIKDKSITNKKLPNSTNETKKSSNEMIKTERKKKKKKNLFKKFELFKKKDIIKVNRQKINKKIHSISLYNKIKRQLIEKKLNDVIFSKHNNNLNSSKKCEIINDMKLHLNNKINNEISNNIKKAPVYIYRIKHKNKYIPIKNYKYSFLFVRKPIYIPLIKYKYIPYYYYDNRNSNTGYILNNPFEIKKIHNLNDRKGKNGNHSCNYISNNNHKINYDNNITNNVNKKMNIVNKGFNCKNTYNNINDYYTSIDEAHNIHNNNHSNFNDTYKNLCKNEHLCVNKKYAWKNIDRKIYAKGKIYINKNNHIINKYNKTYKYHIIRISNRMKNIRYNFFIYNIFKHLYKLSKYRNHKGVDLGEISYLKFNVNNNEKWKNEKFNNFNIHYKIKKNSSSLINYNLNDNNDKMKYLFDKNPNNFNFFEIVQNKKKVIDGNNTNVNGIKSYDNISAFYLKKNSYKDTILKKKKKDFDTFNYNIKNVPKDNKNNIKLHLNNYYKINEDMLPYSNKNKTCSKNCILRYTYSAYNNMNNIYNTKLYQINKNNLTRCQLKVKKIYFSQTNQTTQIKDNYLGNTSLNNTLKDNYFYNINNTNLTNATLKNKNIESFHICSINSLKNKHIKNTKYKHNIENICIYKDF